MTPDQPTSDRPSPEEPSATSPLPSAPTVSWSARADEQFGPDQRIGHYRIVRKLGEGGFGVVYLAEQLEPVQRRVALKIIKLGMDTREVVARFEQERQALAMMDHPCIAKVLDAGATETGRPYFVMEYVAGEPITSYCDRHQLSTRDRLELFVPVCRAVQHAHSKGIIHRDIKPSNVLVSEREVEPGQPPVPEPKVIDFGVAKALSARLVEKTLFTEHGQIIGTPEYMSPEQAETGVVDIDTRSDVYSLGVLLYELLTGLLPFDGHALRAAGYAEIQRIIREVEPPRPSTRLTQAGDSAVFIARQRHTEVDTLARDLRRELEWIPLMAMRKDRAQRYATASELAEDVEHYLSGEPLRAGPESKVYRLRKFVRRNRKSVAAAAVISLALVTATVVSAYFAWRESIARKNESKARLAESQQREVAETVNDFFVIDMLSSPDPENDGPDVMVVTILDRAAAKMQQRFAAQPAVEARLQRTLGEAYLRIGRPKQAQPHLDRAKALVAHLLPSDPEAESRIDLALAEALWRQSPTPESIRAVETLVTRLKADKGAGDALTLEATNELGGAYKASGQLDQAQAIYAEVADGRARTLGPENLDTLITRYNLVLVEVLRGEQLAAAGNREGANTLWEAALAQMLLVQRDTLAALTGSHWQSIAVGSEVAALLNRLGRVDQAGSAYDQLLPEMRRTFGDDHWRTLQAMANYGILCFNSQQFEKCLTLMGEALPGYRRIRGPAFPDTIAVANYLAGAYESLSRFDESIALRIRTYDDMVAANREQAALQRQAGRIRDFYQRRGDATNAERWNVAAGSTPP